MTGWSVCATVKAPEEQVLAFVGHHLDLGAERIALFFDDPDDPAADLIALEPRVSVIRCNARHWQALGDRPERHQKRQSLNAQLAYAQATTPWLAHLDVDEFLWPQAPVAQELAAVPAAKLIQRIAPYEALHDPDRPSGLFSARHFRAELSRPARAGLRDRVFGPYAALLPSGALSHAIGKCFFRTGNRFLRPWIHGAFLHGERLPPGPPHPRIALLHFHAQDRAEWLARLPMRLDRGAYVLKPELHTFLASASAGEIGDFYRHVLTATPEALALLRRLDLLVEADLRLPDRAVALATDLKERSA